MTTWVQVYRQKEMVLRLAEVLRRTVTRPWVLMEVCGSQTHAILRYGLDQLLPPGVELIHGPGCPVCVTPLEKIDRAVWLAQQPGVVLASYGDMLRVPGSRMSLQAARAQGGQVRVVTSPLDAVRLAQEHPEWEVVLFAIGFETTAPMNAMAVLQARALGLRNFSVLASQVRVPPAMRAILQAPGNRVQAFLAAGHVCTVMGTREYEPLAATFGVPIVVTGFEPLDLMRGMLQAVRLLEAREVRVVNAYPRLVRPEGNPAAQAAIAQVFEPCDMRWRGLGWIPDSGWRLRPAFAAWDAEHKFALEEVTAPEPPECRAGEVLQGRLRPPDCPAFGTRCTPAHPLGAPMVSAEGACAAYFQYRLARAAEG